jgi:hypothetical protein
MHNGEDMLLDQCAAHNHEAPSQTLYLSMCVTSHTLTLDQGAIPCTKHAHHKHFVHYYLQETERNVPVPEIMKWNVNDAMRHSAVA